MNFVPPSRQFTVGTRVKGLLNSNCHNKECIHGIYVGNNQFITYLEYPNPLDGYEVHLLNTDVFSQGSAIEAEDRFFIGGYPSSWNTSSREDIIKRAYRGLNGQRGNDYKRIVITLKYCNYEKFATWCVTCDFEYYVEGLFEKKVV